MLAIVDLKISNIQSVLNALARVGIKGQVSSDPGIIGQAKAIILPGVGAFAKGVASLKNNGIFEILKKKALDDKIPFLGICLGMQLMASSSEEGGKNQGLGLIKGDVVKLSPNQPGYLVPNISWCPVIPQKPNLLLPDMQSRESFYFVHSYHLIPEDKKDISGIIEYSGQKICATVEKQNIYGAQFHPEKSQDAGLDLLYNFRLHLESRGAL